MSPMIGEAEDGGRCAPRRGCRHETVFLEVNTNRATATVGQKARHTYPKASREHQSVGPLAMCLIANNWVHQRSQSQPNLMSSSSVASSSCQRFWSFMWDLSSLTFELIFAHIQGCRRICRRGREVEHHVKVQTQISVYTMCMC